MAAITICSDFEAQKNKVCHCFKGEQTESKMTGICEHFSYQPMVQKPLSPGVNYLNGQMDKTAKTKLKKKKNFPEELWIQRRNYCGYDTPILHC